MIGSGKGGKTKRMKGNITRSSTRQKETKIKLERQSSWILSI
jgi:hypothetical protein